MGIITIIDNIPLFSSRKEATSWAGDNNLDGYHEHTVEGITGYMGGKNHITTTGQISQDVAAYLLSLDPTTIKPTQQSQLQNYLRSVASPVEPITAYITPPITPTPSEEGGEY